MTENPAPVQEVIVNTDELDDIVQDPEKLKTLLTQILQNLTLLNYLVYRMAEMMGEEIPDSKDLGTGGYL